MTAGGSFREAASRILVQRLSSTGRDLTYPQSYPHRWITTVASNVRCEGISAPGTSHRDDGCGNVAHASKTLQALRTEASLVDCAQRGVYTGSVQRMVRG